MSAILFIRSKLDLRDHQLDLGKIALGSSGDGETIKRQLREWEKQLE